jgi:nucleotide-binding universal stress UspA family protein
MFDKIVVGYASDQAGRDAVSLAADLAATLRSQLTVVYPDRPLSAATPPATFDAAVRRDVAAIAAPLSGLHEVAFHSTSSSWPIHAMHEFASTEAADLIVVGSAHDDLPRHLHVGLLQRMVDGAPCAVALAPVGYAGDERHRISHIGVGFADSREGISAAYLGHELASLLAGDLELIAGAGLSTSTHPNRTVPVPRPEDDSYDELQRRLKHLAGGLADNVPVRLLLDDGQPYRVLVERSRHLDLLVLGSRSYGPLRHTLLGSVSAAVIDSVSCPCVVVPRAGDEYRVASCASGEADVVTDEANTRTGTPLLR